MPLPLTFRLMLILAVIVLVSVAILLLRSNLLYAIRTARSGGTSDERPSYVLEPGWMWALGIVCALAVYSMWFSRFLASDEWIRVSVYVAVAIFVLVFALAAKTYPFCADTTAHPRRNRWTRALMLAFGFSLFSQFALVGYCAEVVNFFIGSDTDRVVVVTGYNIGIKYGCSHPEIGQPIFGSALCYLPYSRDALTPGTELHLHGPASWLGMKVERVSIAG